MVERMRRSEILWKFMIGFIEFGNWDGEGRVLVLDFSGYGEVSMNIEQHRTNG